jgi:hypothetical protein
MAVTPPVGQYKIQVYDPSGTLVAVLDKWQRLEFKHIINTPDYCKIQLNGDEDWESIFEVNSVVEVWRKVPGYSPDGVPPNRLKAGGWYVEWDGLHSDHTHTTFRNGRTIYTSYCDGYLDLIQRREVLYYASETASRSKKSATPAQTAIYEFVEENCGASATVAGGRLYEGTITGLSIPFNVGGGNNWSGARAYRNVLEVIRDIGELENIDFDVVGLGGANWSFETYLDQMGEDRTTTGLDPSTGLNAAGNAPVIFSLANDNISQATYKNSRRNSANVIACLGKGKYADRAYYISADATEIDANRINQREMCRNASSQDDAAELISMSEEYLNEFQPIEDFLFTPLSVESTIYGVHYWWGDRCTSRYRSLELDKRLTGVSITVDDNGETFSSWDFKNVARE